MPLSTWVLYIIIAFVAASTALSVLVQPLLWPLALAALLFIVVDLCAYRFPFYWYITSHPLYVKSTAKKAVKSRKKSKA